VIVDYLFVKFAHIFLAVVALGGSAGLAIVLEFYGDDATHGSFILRAIGRITAFFVLPGYVLVLATGLWMLGLSWSFTEKWIRAALVLWVIGVVALVSSLAALRQQRKLFDAVGPESLSYRRISTLSRLLGGGFGFTVIGMLYLMVFKPWH
jgi:uncharacterized membrane protein